LFFFPNWKRNTFVRVQNNSKFANEKRVTIKTFIPLKAASMHILLHLNEDFDDDLLMDCIEMLYGIWLMILIGIFQKYCNHEIMYKYCLFIGWSNNICYDQRICSIFVVFLIESIYTNNIRVPIYYQHQSLSEQSSNHWPIFSILHGSHLN